MNKKGIVRIIESTLAVIIVLSSLILISHKTPVVEQKDLSLMIPNLLDEVATNQTLRDAVIRGVRNNSEIKVGNFIGSLLTGTGLKYKVEICGLQEVCFLDPYPNSDPENIYAGERIISSSFLGGVSPKRIKLFLWR